MILHYLEHESWNEKDNDYTGIPSAVFMNFINHSKCIASFTMHIIFNKNTYRNNKLEKCFFIADWDFFYLGKNENRIKKLIKKYISYYNMKYKTNIKNFYIVDKTNINKIIKYEF